jgi:hypothetical protein
MVVTDRDRRAIDFITRMHCVSTKTIHELFYPSLRVAQNRLKLMTENRLIKRDRDHFTSQFYYYAESKPKQVYHNLLLTEFYKELSKIATIEIFKKEYTIEDIRPDALVVYTIHGKSYIAFIEVELSNIPNIVKYERLYKSGNYKQYFNNIYPLIYYITDKNIPDTKLKVVKINEDMSNFKEVLQ